MVTKPKPSKRDAILEAMMDIVVERGFHDAPISLIAQRSGASPGIIYHYFTSKEEIIGAIYERTSALKHEAFLVDFDATGVPDQVFCQTFVNVYHFYRQHQREMRFFNLCKQAGFSCTVAPANRDERFSIFAKRFSSRSRGGVLRDWSSDVIEEMTLGLIERLAARPKKIAESQLLEIAQSVWETVKAK